MKIQGQVIYHPSNSAKWVRRIELKLWNMWDQQVVLDLPDTIDRMLYSKIRYDRKHR